MKKWLSVLMALIMTVLMMTPVGVVDFSSFAASAVEDSEAEIVESGVCGAEGDNVVWTLYSDGTLILSGEGETAPGREVDENEEYHFLFKDKDIKKVIIEDGITSIGELLFYMSKVESVEIAKSVERIDLGAFYMCINLKSVTFEKGSELTFIGDSAFSYNTKLERIDIPDSVSEIGIYAFFCCVRLKEIHLPANLESNVSESFVECGFVESLVIPKNVKECANISFHNFPTLNTIFVLSDDFNFENSQFGYSDYVITDVEEFKLVLSRMYDIYTCVEFEERELSEEENAEIEELEERSSAIIIECDEPQKIEGFTIVANKGSTAEAYAKENGFNFIDLNEYEDGGVYTVESGVCGAEGDNVVWTLYSDGTLILSGEGETAPGREVDENGEEHFLFKDKNFKKVIVEDGITSIGELLFCASKIESIEIAKSVETIGFAAFSNCYNLSSVIFEKGSQLKSIKSNAFCMDISLEYMDIPNSVTDIGEAVFTNCVGLEELYLPANLESPIEQCLLYILFLDNLIVPKTTKQIVMSGEDDILLNKVFVLSDDLDLENSSLGFSSLQCSDFEQAKLTYRRLMELEFKFDELETELSEEEIAEIEKEAAELSEKFESLIITYDEPQKVEGFTIVARKGSTAEAYAKENGFNFVDLDENGYGNVPILESGVCGKDGDNLKWELDKYGRLTISGEGEMADYLLSMSEDGDQNEHLEDAPWKSLSDEISTIIIEDGVTSIGNFAFSQCVKAESIVIADTVNEIGVGAFDSCVRLKSIDIPYGVLKIEMTTFDDCVSLESVVIPNSVETISEGAFDNCFSLTEITLPASVKLVKGQALADCYLLKKITVENPDVELSTHNKFGSDEFYPAVGFKWTSYNCSIEELKDLYIEMYDAESKEDESKSEEVFDRIMDFVDTDFEGPDAIDGVVFYGYDNSTAQIYADEYGFEFVTLDQTSGHTHTVVIDEAVAPTCVKTGLTQGSHCSDCGEVLTAQESISALGHKNSDWIIDKEADCTNSGSKHIECTVCGEAIETAEIPATGHTFGDWTVTKPATCTEKGEETRTCACGEKEVRDIAVTEHKAVIDEAVAPTCVKTGLTQGSHCSDCGEVLTAQESIPALGHKNSDWIIDKEADCTNSGSKHIECTVCGEAIETAEIPATGHTFGDWTVTKSATCTEKGEETRTCACGEKEVRDIAVTEHKAVIDEAVTPTCVKTGLTQGSHCLDCGEVLTAQESIPALGHSFTKYISNNNATCTAYGTETASCDNGCGEKNTRPVSGSMLAHSFTEWTTVKAPTCTEKGAESRQCSLCGKTETKDIDATGHNYGDDNVCANCGDVKECTCNCHKTGFANLIFRFIIFFQKIFKMNKVCACGAVHY